MKDSKISIFRYLFESKDVPYQVTLENALNRIKNGAKSIDLIKQIRIESDANKRNILKRDLPCYLFSGTFKERNSNGLENHIGIAILDFDKFKGNDLELTRDLLKKNKHILSVFLSPSGLGLKALLRIPKADKITHPKYFKAFQKEFDFKYFDISNSNIDRVCFESYDPEIYINWDAKVYSPVLNDEGFERKDRVPVIPIQSEDQIVEKIMSWNWNKDFVEGERNAYIFDLASAFCEYGVSKDYAEGYILNNVVIGDFTEREATNTIKSAYRTRQFGIKYFEDYRKINNIKKDLSKGKDNVKKKHGISDEVFDEIKIEDEQDDFWYFDVDKNGNEKCKVDLIKYKKFLESSGFKKYFPFQTQKPTWVKIVSNQVEETSVEKIKDFVLNYLLDRKEIKAWSYFAGYATLFSETFLLMLDTVDLMILKDLKDKSFIAYQNGILEVTKNSVKLVEYVDVDGYIWKNHIIPRNYKESESTDNDYKTFVKNISNNNPLPIETAIGYLISTYKNKMNNKAIILNDEVITENPEGGTGKGLLIQGVREIRRVSILDGKSFDDKKSFPYQTVSQETQILVFDDVKKNFDFESKFSLVTEGMTLERKNKDAIKLSVEDSPKVVISTNYAIKGEGNSHDRRRHELEVSQYYGKYKTPFKEFGREMFSDWNETEFLCFDNYMIGCLQSYLKNGLVAQESANIKKRKFIAETSMEFLEWVSDSNNFVFHQKLDKSLKFNEFVNDYKDFQKFLSRKKFTIWCNKYANYIDHNFYQGHSGSFQWMMITSNEYTEDELNNLSNNIIPF
jgi:hypothetical protein